MPWLTEDTVRPDAQRLMDIIEEDVSQRERSIATEYDFESIARVVTERLIANQAIRRVWWFASLGVDESRETYYLSKAAHAYFFAHLNVLPWTNWMGSLYVHLREAARGGRLPYEFKYGPPRRECNAPIGPLVDYVFSNGSLQKYTFFSTQPPVQVKDLVPVLEEAPKTEPLFGLKEIIRTIDIAQDTNIRGPMEGVFILIGGPGVGKTTVALHRIPYLIIEHGEICRRKGEPKFFTQESTIVVVWKEHLVPYLKNCVNQLDCDKVSVLHVEDWVASNLRPYVSMGPGATQYRRVEEAQEVAQVKLSLSERELHGFVFSQHHFAVDSIERIDGALERIERLFEEAGYDIRLFFRPEDYRFSASGIEGAMERLRHSLAEADDAFKSELELPTTPSNRRSMLKQLREEVLPRARRQLSELRAGEIRQLGLSYPKLLEEFYRSEIVQQLVTSRSGVRLRDQFISVVEKQAVSRQLSTVDRYFLLWIVYFLTRREGEEKARSEAKNVRPLPQYCHVMVDEAQYYHPLLLRLFARLTLSPFNSMTIVGDLEQKITAKDGLLNWEDVGLRVPPENINRLETNYRWSRQVFRFLKQYKQVARLMVTLQEPHDWPSGEGKCPQLLRFADRNAEIQWVVNRISQLKGDEPSSRWTIVVVFPEEVVGAAPTEWAVKKMIAEWRSCDIKARWAIGEDIKESTEQVILTNYDSIVGLEFDAVFVIAADRLLKDANDRDSVLSVWVAITRARQFIALTYSEITPLLDRPEFTGYRIPSSETRSSRG